MKELILSQLNINTIIWVLGGLSALITYVRKMKPKLNGYFEKATPILAEVDDVIDVVAEEYPGNATLQTADKVLDKVVSELEQAGYKLDEQDKKKVEIRTKSKLGNSQSTE